MIFFFFEQTRKGRRSHKTTPRSARPILLAAQGGVAAKAEVKHLGHRLEGVNLLVCKLHFSLEILLWNISVRPVLEYPTLSGSGIFDEKYFPGSKSPVCCLLSKPSKDYVPHVNACDIDRICRSLVL